MQKNIVDFSEMKWRVEQWSVMGCKVTSQMVSDYLGKEWSLHLQNGTRQNVVECRGMEGSVVDQSGVGYNVT